MDTYQSLLGISDLTADVMLVDTMVVQKDLTVFGNATLSGLTLPTGAALNKVLTSDLQGNATWQTQQEQVLSGDAVGPASSNRIDKLAGGTIPVPSLVTLAALQTLTNKTLVGPTNLIEANSIRNTGTWVVPFSGSAPITSNILTFDGTNAVWSPAGNLTGDVTSVGLATTLGNLSGDITSIGRVTTAGATIVKTTAVQTLTNKTIKGTTNLVDANTIRNGSTWAIDFAGSAPVSSNILTYNGTNAVWSPVGNLTGDVTSVGLATTLGNLSGDITSVGRVTTAGATIVKTTVAQTLTNKNIKGTTNQIDANAIRSGSTWAIDFGGSFPASSNVLTFNGTNAIWAAPSAGNLTGDITSVGLATTAGPNIVTLTGTQTLANKTLGYTVLTKNLSFNNNYQNKMINLYDDGTLTDQTQHNFYGFGVAGGILRYQADTTTTDHVFYAATSSTASNELFRIKGTGAISCAGNISSGGLITGGILSTGVTSSGTISTPVLNATNGFITPANGQGVYIGWNKSTANAETNLINNTPFGSGGSGGGGWEFSTRTSDGVYGVKMTVNGSTGNLTVPSISCSGNITTGSFTLSGGISFTNGTLSNYQEITYDSTWSGPITTGVLRLLITKIGRVVTATMATRVIDIPVTTSGVFLWKMDIPILASFLPNAANPPGISIPVPIVTNSAQQIGLFTINQDTRTIALKPLNSASWSVTAGFSPWSVSWTTADQS